MRFAVGFGDRRRLNSLSLRVGERTAWRVISDCFRFIAAGLLDLENKTRVLPGQNNRVVG
jgi:hypothetical protein